MDPNTKPYRCVNCGNPAPALYREYSKSVLKLSKCESCDNIVDKYIEYDPVIIMVDLVLITKEAQRHILYNTSFKEIAKLLKLGDISITNLLSETIMKPRARRFSIIRWSDDNQGKLLEAYWKLFVALVLLETYSVWSQESITNLVLMSVCSRFDSRNLIYQNFTDRYLVEELSSSTPHLLEQACGKWLYDVRPNYEDTELCIAEKAFYVTFSYITLGILAFTLCIYSLMKVIKIFPENQVTFIMLLKAVTLGSLGNLFSLPSLIWGSHDKAVHVLLVFSYTLLSFCSVILVLYKTSKPTTVIILLLAYIAKFVTTFIMKHLLDITLKLFEMSF